MEGGESKEGGGDGYGSVGEMVFRFEKMDEGSCEEILICRLGCPCPFPCESGCKCAFVETCTRGRPAVGYAPVPVAAATGNSGVPGTGVGGELPFNSFSSVRLMGSIISRAASTLRILFSPRSTSLFAVLYMYKPRNVIPIPRPCMGCTFWLNHTMAIQMTATRLMREAIEYVTGDVLERITNAMMFCAKWTVPFMKK